MSRYIATRALRGANALVTEAEVMLHKALVEKGPDAKVAFPNTAYYMPMILGMTGEEVDTIGQMKPILEFARSLLHPLPSEAHWTHDLGETLDPGGNGQRARLASRLRRATTALWYDQGPTGVMDRHEYSLWRRELGMQM